MELKKKTDNFFTNIFHQTFVKNVALFIVLILFTLAVFVFGGVVQKRGIFSNIKESLDLYVPINYLRGNLSNSAETIFIDIKFKKFLTLEAKRNEALNSGLLISDEYIPGKITVGESQYKVNIRLKGDLTDHLEGKKWSFRIKTKGDNTIFGMKQFSIHHPKARNNIYEWVFHKFLKKEGLVALRYKFIEVILNGENLGIYAVEEHFEKRLVENSQKKAGPIIRFNEELYWERFKVQNKSGKGALLDYGRVLSSNIDAFKTSSYLTDTLGFKNFSKAIALLESFRMGEKSTSEVFDIDLLSTFYAMIDLFGANHALYYHNLRYYYNPITAYLEPIGFDGFNGGANEGFETKYLMSDIDNKVNKLNDSGIRDYLQLLFDDENFYKLYIQKLNIFSSTSYLDSALKGIDKELAENLRILHSEWPYLSFKREILYHNQNLIKQFLNPPKAVHSYIKGKSNEGVTISFNNIQLLPIKINNLILNDSLFLIPSNDKSIPGKNFNSNVDFFTIYFLNSSNLDLINNDSISYKINYEIIGTKNQKTVEVFPWDNYQDSIVEDDFVRKKSNLSKFNFIYKIEQNNQIIFKSGLHDIDESIHIPSGYDVIIPEGTIINLTNSASIISRSPIFLRGSKQRPIKINSSDSTGQGIFVFKTNKRSILEHVFFDNLSSPIKNSWSLTGAITFYESDISINNSYFSNNVKGDDYLNIVRSSFSINNCNFTNVVSDAFDADFSLGSMSNNTFNNCGNDGIDISGTDLYIEDLLMNNIGDKGMSSGERSKITASKVVISNSEIAVCSKDNSLIKISNATLNSNKIAFTAFQKKPEFGPAEIIGSNIEINNNLNSFLIESSSIFTLDKVRIESNNEKVKDLLYGVIYGKSSK